MEKTDVIQSLRQSAIDLHTLAKKSITVKGCAILSNMSCHLSEMANALDKDIE